MLQRGAANAQMTFNGFFFFWLICHWGLFKMKYLCHCYKNNCGRGLTHSIVMSLQRPDLCEQSLGAAACWGRVCVLVAKAGRSYFCVRQLWFLDNLCLMMHPPSDMLFKACSSLGRWIVWLSGLRFGAVFAKLNRAYPTHFQSRMNTHLGGWQFFCFFLACQRDKRAHCGCLCCSISLQ